MIVGYIVLGVALLGFLAMALEKIFPEDPALAFTRRRRAMGMSSEEIRCELAMRSAWLTFRHEVNKQVVATPEKAEEIRNRTAAALASLIGDMHGDAAMRSFAAILRDARDAEVYDAEALAALAKLQPERRPFDPKVHLAGVAPDVMAAHLAALYKD